MSLSLSVASAVPSIVSTLGPDWLDPQNLDRFGTAAFWIALGIIFAECGLLIGFFLPGDSLLFMVGLFIASGVIDIPIQVACLLLSIAAVAGNLTGYWIGYRAGPPLFNRPDSRFFRQEYVDKTHGFFDKYGSRAIVLARFVPIVRRLTTPGQLLLDPLSGCDSGLRVRGRMGVDRTGKECQPGNLPARVAPMRTRRGPQHTHSGLSAAR